MCYAAFQLTARLQGKKTYCPTQCLFDIVPLFAFVSQRWSLNTPEQLGHPTSYHQSGQQLSSGSAGFLPPWQKRWILRTTKTVLQAQPSPTEPRVSKAWATWASGKICKNQARNHSHRSCPCKPNKLWVGLTLPSRIMPRCVYALSIWPYSPSRNCIAASFFTLRQNTPQSGCDRVASPQNTEEKWIMKECMSECI